MLLNERYLSTNKRHTSMKATDSEFWVVEGAAEVVVPSARASLGPNELLLDWDLRLQYLSN
jgi:hypothetical protein